LPRISPAYGGFGLLSFRRFRKKGSALNTIPEAKYKHELTLPFSLRLVEVFDRFF